MKSRKNIIILAVLAGAALALFFGGQAMVNHAQADREADAAARQAEQQAQLEEARKAEQAVDNLPTVTLVPIVATAAPTQSDSIQETPKPMPSATITTEPDGSITITPDFEAQAGAATQLQKPSEKSDANMGGGGGELPLGEDGAYHGDNKPTPKPVQPTQAPQPTQTPTDTSQAPSPAPAPSGGQQSGNDDGPPSGTGYNGEIRGEWGWLDGFGWIKTGGSNGGTGGQIDDSDKGWAPGEGGATVGTM